MQFKNFFDFLTSLKNNQSCRLSGGGNSSWSLDHNINSDHCELEFIISGSGGNSEIKLKIENAYILDTVDKICEEIKLYQSKYPNRIRF